jgi:hypothetical protein
VKSGAWLFSRVLEERYRAGVRAGLISAAATSGVLVAFGLGAGSIARPFLFLGQYLGGYRDVTIPPAVVILAGLLLHAAWIIAWCVAFSIAAFDARPWSRIPLVVATVLAAFLTSSRIIGSALDYPPFGGGRWVVLHIVFAVALYKGTRFAQV